MQTTITADRDGWLTITLPCGLQIVVPQDDCGTDERVEIRSDDHRRIWVDADLQCTEVESYTGD